MYSAFGLKRIKSKQCLVLTVGTHCFILNDYRLYTIKYIFIITITEYFSKLVLQKSK